MSVEINVSIRLYDKDGEPVEGVRIDLSGKYGINQGFVGEEVTDSDGYVTFNDVEGWKTYTVWIDHEDLYEIELAGEDDDFEYKGGRKTRKNRKSKRSKTYKTHKRTKTSKKYRKSKKISRNCYC